MKSVSDILREKIARKTDFSRIYCSFYELLRYSNGRIHKHNICRLDRTLGCCTGNLLEFKKNVYVCKKRPKGIVVYKIENKLHYEIDRNLLELSW